MEVKGQLWFHIQRADGAAGWDVFGVCLGEINMSIVCHVEN